MEIGFDIIGDLDLSPDDLFDWENKATSLYCVITGNISKDLRTILNTLVHLSRHYQGIFYNIGTLEYSGATDSVERTLEILDICKNIPNVAVLHHHVVIIDGIAILGANGWDQDSIVDEPYATNFRLMRFEDINYLNASIEKLQKYLDVTNILVVTSAVPNESLYFGQAPQSIKDQQVQLSYCLGTDTEMKVTKWAFGTYNKEVDTVIEGIHYVCNPHTKDMPYWAKRIKIIP